MSDMSILLIECHARRASDGAAQTLRLASGGVRADYFGVQWLPALIELPVMGARLGFDGRSFTAPVTSTVGGFSFSRNFKGLEGAQDLIWKGADITIWQGTPDNLSVVWTGRAQGSSARDAAIVVDLADPAEEMAKPLVDQRFAGTGGLEGGEDVEGRIKPRAWGLCENIPAILIDAPNNIWLLVDGPSTVHDVRDGGVAYIGPRVDVADYAALAAEEIPSGGIGVCEALSLVKPWRVPRFTLTANITAGTAGTAADIAQAMLGERTSLTFAPGVVAGYVQQPSVSSYVADERTLAQEFDRLFGGLGSFWRFNSESEIELGLIDFAAPTLTFDKGVVSVTRARIIMPTYRRVLTYRPNYRPMSDGELAQGIDEADLGPGAYASSLFELDADQAMKLEGIEAGATAGAEFGVNIGGLGGSPQGIDLLNGAEWAPRLVGDYLYLGIPEQGLSLASLGLQVGDYVSYSAHVDDVGTANPTADFLLRPRDAGFALLQNKKKSATTPGWLSDTLLIPANCEYLEFRTNTGTGAFTASKVQLVKGAYPLMGQQGAAPGATVGATSLQVAQINQALSDALNARAVADGKIVTFAQATQPSGQAEGDLWIDTDDGNKLYRWNGGAWVMLQDTAIGDAIAMASDAFARADEKIVTFSSETAPTADGEGDLWQKPSTRQLYRWNGQAWDAITAAGVQDGADVTRFGLFILDNQGKPAGIHPVESISHRSQLQFGGVGVQILGEPDVNVAYGFPAIPIDDTATYTLSVRHKSSASSTQGLYIRFQEYDAQLPNNVTHIGESGTAAALSSLQARSSFKDLVGNGPMPGTTLVEDVYTYQPTPGAKFATLSFYSWSAYTGTYELESVRLTRQGSSVNLLSQSITDALTLVNGPAEAGAEANTAGTLALIINQQYSASGALQANTGEALLIGTKSGQPDITKDGYINWNGQRITIERVQYYTNVTVATNGPNTQGFIVFDTLKRKTFAITNSSPNGDVAFVRKNNGQWQYDNNSSSTWVNFTPDANIVALGWLKTGASDQIVAGGLFGQPVPLELATFPSADVTGDNTAMAVMGQGAGATANSLMEMNPGEGTKLAGIQAGATVGARAGVNLLDGQGVQLFDWDVRNNIDQSIRTPGGGVLTGTTSVQTGSLKIRLPQSWTSTMMKFTVDIFEYTAGYSCTLEIAGYNYYGNTRWLNVTARVIGGSNVEYPVYFGHDGTKCCVWIGDASETWSYPQVRVRDVLLGYSSTTRALWDTGWQISFDAGGAQNVTAQVDDTYPAADWRKVTGPGRPEDGATMGADWGTNVTNIPYDQVISNADDVALGFNPTFAKWTGTFPDGWGTWVGSPTKETSIVRVGSYAARFQASGNSMGMVRTLNFGDAGRLPAGSFVSGSVDLYLVSRTSGLPGILIDLGTNSSFSSYRRTVIQPESTATGAWQRIPWTARVNPGERIYGIRIYVMGSWNGFPSGYFTGTVIFDNIRFALLDASTDNKAVAISSNGTLSGAGGGQVTITGLGYTGAMNATYGASWGSNVTGRPPELTDGRITYALSSSGRLIDSRRAAQSFTGGISNTITSSAYFSVTTTTITVNSHTRRYDFGNLTYNTGSIGGRTSNTLYYIYADDPNYNGGAVTYQASTSLSSACSPGRIYLGSVRTASSSGGGGGTFPPGDCVCVNMFVADGKRAGDLSVGDTLDLMDDDMRDMGRGPVTAYRLGHQPCVELVTKSARVIVSTSAPVVTKEKGTLKAPDVKGLTVAVLIDGVYGFETVLDVRDVGARPIARISVGGISYAAGVEPNRLIFTHNIYAKP